LYDVAVIGGGPVGSYTAYKLAGMGYDVVVLDAKERPGEMVCCTGIIGRECLDSFDIDDKVVLRWVNSARLFSPSGRLIHLWRQEDQACIVDRAAFDMAIAKRAQSEGAEYLLSSPVSSVEIGDDRVRVEAACHGTQLNIEARVVVIATGFGSKLIRALGLGKVGDFVMGAQSDVETAGINEVEIYFGRKLAPGFFAWLVPTSSRRARVGLLSRRNPGHYLKQLVLFLKTQGKIVAADTELSYGGIPLKPLSRTYGERLVVVGDVAGQVKPTTGGGIYYGLLCAGMAARNLDLALKGDALMAKDLAGYEQEWKSRLGRELRRGYLARQFYECLSDQQVDRIFDIAKSNGIAEALLKDAEVSFDWHAEVVLRLLAHRVISKAVGAMKIPFGVD
jgi:geranylgeranyl reductase family protein